MIAAFLALAVLITGILLMLVWRQNRHQKPVHKRDAKSVTPAAARPAEKKYFPAGKPASQRNPEAPMSDPAPGASDAYADLRKFLRKGIEDIFDGGAPASEDDTKPLTRRDIEPQMFEDVLGHIAGLRHFRAQQVRLQKMVHNPSVQMTDLSRIILSDPVMTAKILRMANSSYFGMQQKIDSISHALMLLGLQNIKNILYREGIREIFQAESPLHREAVAALWRHSSLTSVCAQYLCDLFDGLNRGTLFTLGIVHDIGKLITLELPQVKSLPMEFREKFPSGLSVGEEDRLLGINHAVIGGMALEHWNFSELMIDVVSAHHEPPYVAADQAGLEDEKLKYTLVLFLADQLAGLLEAWSEGDARPYRLHKSYLSLLNKNKLISKMMDANFLSQIRETERLALDEQAYKRREDPEERQGAPRPFPEAGAGGSGSTARVIGRYEVIRELGRGTMGIVYLARDPLIHREVAIKTLRYRDVDAQKISEAKARFFMEAGIVGKLSHPNIVTIYDVGDFSGGTYIAMEFLDGMDLATFCLRQNRLPLTEIIRILSSVALALDYAHQMGVIHRDIKPGNIRLLENKTVKVIDFGVADFVEASPSSDVVIWGSPHYMSPEQIGGQSVDGRSDLFSLGVIFYELLTGVKPFLADDLTSLIVQIKTEEPIPVHVLAPDVPEDCAAIVEKCLAKEKDQRYTNGRELADALSACLYSVERS